MMLRGALGVAFVATIAGAARSQRKASAAPAEVRSMGPRIISHVV
jgi:hypothetical protein